MMSRARFLVLAVVAALALTSQVGLPIAHAASATESQFADLTVSLTVPDQAKVGETISATMVISNNSAKLLPIVVKGIWTEPSGESTVQTKSGMLFPGQTVTRVVDYVVSEKVVPGIHEITLSVETQGGTSSATAPVEVI
jgi:hypothetical protein